jgi:hypothetical protein
MHACTHSTKDTKKERWRERERERGKVCEGAENAFGSSPKIKCMIFMPRCCACLACVRARKCERTLCSLGLKATRRSRAPPLIARAVFARVHICVGECGKTLVVSSSSHGLMPYIHGSAIIYAFQSFYIDACLHGSKIHLRINVSMRFFTHFHFLRACMRAFILPHVYLSSFVDMKSW